MNLWMTNAVASQLNDPWASSFQPESEAIFAEMVPAPDPARKALIDAAIVSMKAGGVLAKLDCLHWYPADSELSSQLNWANPSGPAGSLVNDAFWNADSSVCGASTPGSGILTAFTPSAGVKFRHRHAEIGYYLHTAPAVPYGSSSHRPLLGATDTNYVAFSTLPDHEALPGAWCLAYRKADNRLRIRMATDMSVESPNNVANDVGMHSFVNPNVSGSEGLRAWEQGDTAHYLDVSLTGATFGRPAVPVALAAVNMGNGLWFQSDARFRMFYAGADLTIAERNVLVSALETFVAAL